MLRPASDRIVLLAQLFSQDTCHLHGWNSVLLHLRRAAIQRTSKVTEVMKARKNSKPATAIAGFLVNLNTPATRARKPKTTAHDSNDAAGSGVRRKRWGSAGRKRIGMFTGLT